MRMKKKKIGADGKVTEGKSGDQTYFINLDIITAIAHHIDSVHRSISPMYTVSIHFHSK